MSDRTSDRQLTEQAAGELRERLRNEGWSSDLGWTSVGSGSAGAYDEAHRTIAYLTSVRAVDGGASRMWKDGDVPAPPEADAREVFTAREDDTEWHSELLEAPVETTATEPGSPSEADDNENGKTKAGHAA
ncbi:hypothetical protein ER308_09705 [Egibacter rhizosphaerae]|uniref:Uncharacterized protein n=1 Tax=Egibacter rhizosphaerae TaxID=1670831 RepID=A0A411YEX0_9ACTN|nr:hypothetical protein [Egibacter rhizosphaerae]QBI19803.1 hypothetical protein ER308_09705 [Egibacter rhizosphaerae]